MARHEGTARDGRRLSRIRLPNGLVIAQVNAAETSLQYRNIFVEDQYTAHPIELRDGDVVLDVGANIGLASLRIHACASGIHLYAFEPDPLLCDAARANFTAHGLQGQVFELALSNHIGTTTLTIYEQATAMSGLYADPSSDLDVTRQFLRNSGLASHDVDDLVTGLHDAHMHPCRTTTLSQWLREHAIARVDLLKLNVEKSEEDVLQGLSDEDWSCIRQVVVQIHDIGGRVARLRQMLEDRGFAVDVHQHPLLVQTPIFDCTAVRPSRTSRS